ncbi:MAG: hypothetical protein CM1200mP24_02010 [Gammaproteobacteria bacterium]|nr:MAG: hypothetical protein CM1200mP24_02010 [Gammaproteobacteria bacterium]
MDMLVRMAENGWLPDALISPLVSKRLVKRRLDEEGLSRPQSDTRDYWMSPSRRASRIAYRGR